MAGGVALASAVEHEGHGGDDSGASADGEGSTNHAEVLAPVTTVTPLGGPPRPGDRSPRVDGMLVGDLPTPSLLVDVHAFDRNVATMAKRWPGHVAAARM